MVIEQPHFQFLWFAHGDPTEPSLRRMKVPPLDLILPWFMAHGLMAHVSQLSHLSMTQAAPGSPKHLQDKPASALLQIQTLGRLGSRQEHRT